MRKIKFRAKAKGLTDWMYGSLIYFDDSQTAHIIPYGSYKGGHIVCEFCEADKDTIGQFTGILDVDGNEIFEGDILVFGNPDSEYDYDRCPFEIAEDNPPYIVKWHVEGFSLICSNNDAIEGFDFIDEKTLANKNFKVLGNIHDNPELITHTPLCN